MPLIWAFVGPSQHKSQVCGDAKIQHVEDELVAGVIPFLYMLW